MATGEMIGHNRPVGRVTVGRNVLKGHMSNSQPGVWRNILFEQPRQVELPYVKTIEISRSNDSDAATCTITLYNDYWEDPRPQGVDTLGRAGYRTFNRGVRSAVPQRSIYEDFETGARQRTDNLCANGSFELPVVSEITSVIPESWRNGNDDEPVDQIKVAPSPTAPEGQQVLELTNAAAGRNSFLEQIISATESGVWVTAYASVWIYDGGFVGPAYGERGLMLSVVDAEQPGEPTVAQSSARILATTPRNQWHTLQTRVFIPSETVNPRIELRLYAPGGVVRWDDAILIQDLTSTTGTEYPTDWGYPLPGDEPGSEFVSAHKIYDGGSGGEGGPNAAWARGLLIPNRVVRTFQGYGSDNFDDGGNERGRGDPQYIPPYNDNQLVQTGVWMIDRVTYAADGSIRLDCRDLSKLLLTQIMYPTMVPLDRFPLRYCPLYELSPETGQPMPEPTGDPGDPHIITDWSEVIRDLLGWAGFTWYAPDIYWPGMAPDPRIGYDAGTGVPLRVWGDIEVLGAGPIVCTPREMFLNKTFAEGITLIRDMIGALFRIDESGRAIFRLANIWSGGNFIHDPLSPLPDPYIDQHPIEFHENANLLEYSVVLDDSAVRSEVLVTGASAETSGTGHIQGGYSMSSESEPNAIDFTNVLAGQTRLMFVPREDTQFFRTVEECQRMAELVAMRILFTYRRGSLRAPCHPGLQVDDQVRIYERVTHEANVHYVSGISTHMDLEAGSWTMEVTTHWLGDDPYTNWFLRYNVLTDAVLQLPAIQNRMGATP